MALALLHRLSCPVADADLLARFVADRDEVAFAELVRRHGPIVYRVCRRLVGSQADDAFQATFLILATRATTVREPGAVGGWLVGVAGRVARQMQMAARRRTRQERTSSERRPDSPATHPVETAELARVLGEELARLPDRLREPAVLCLVVGRTQEQAAADLGGSVRTVRRRLDEAKSLLRRRLERRGVVPAVAVGLVAWAGEGLTAVPTGLTRTTVEVAFDFLAGGARTVPAAAIVKGVTMTLLARKVGLALVATAIGMVGFGVGFADDGKPAQKMEKSPPAAVTVPPPATIPPQNVPPAPNPAAGPPPAAPKNVIRTTNFDVTGSSPAVCAQVAEAAERHRKRLAEEWFGRELPAWESRCPVQLLLNGAAPTGSTTFTYADGKMASARMQLAGELDTILAVSLPHEVMHCVLATHFGRPLPRWADEGIAVLAEPAAEQHKLDVRCRELINQGRAIQLKTLFPMMEYPQDATVATAQGYSVCRFLLTRPLTPALTLFDAVKTPPPSAETQARTGFLVFLLNGMDRLGWDVAAHQVYGFNSVDALQEQWIESLRVLPPAPSVPAAWVGIGKPPAVAVPAAFVTENLSPAVARALTQELVVQRRTMAEKWFDGPPPAPTRPHHVTYRPDPRANSWINLGQTTTHPLGEPGKPHFVMFSGPLDQVLDGEVPAMMVRAAFLDRDTDLPDWAIAGVPMVEGTAATQRGLDVAARKLVTDGQAVRLSAFFRDADIHTAATKAQAHSVARFLLTRPVAGTTKHTPQQMLTEFLTRQKALGWDGVSQQVYGFRGVDDLEALWLAWLKTPGSKFPDEASAAPASTPPVPRIPATKLDGR